MSKYSNSPSATTSNGWVEVSKKSKKKSYKVTSCRSWKDHAKSLSEKKNPDIVSTKVNNVHPLNDTWVLWYHDTKESDWTINGYEKLFEFDTVEDFWILYNSLVDITSNMYYLMRKGYPPIWDDPKNKEGSGWTFKVDKRNLTKFWEDMSCFCVGETICSQSENIIGLSISPKIRFATVRVWTSDRDESIDKFENVSQYTSNSSIVIDFNYARFTANSSAAT